MTRPADGDPALLPAHELARGIRRRAWSSVELLDHFAARVERLDGRINAMPVRDLDRAREAVGRVATTLE